MKTKRSSDSGAKETRKRSAADARNVPLNNQLQRLVGDALDAEQRSSARQAFEPRWNRWNRIRTALAGVSAALMTTLLAIL